jgi:glycosyltransferase involved in cell wall biosynthesis
MAVHDPSVASPAITGHGAKVKAFAAPRLSRARDTLPLSHASFVQPDYLVGSAWIEHAPFLSWLVEARRPTRFVELGADRGFSYFVACQAVKRLGLPTACFAVDAWADDEPDADGGETVFRTVDAYNARHYAAFSQLMRATFREAAARFGDGSVDLLHVDGRDRHGDLVDDMAAWRPKLSSDAIVVLHGTNVRDPGSGIWRLFDELRRQYPAYEFVHGGGLGIVAFGRIPPGLEGLFAAVAEDGAFPHVPYATLGRAIAERWRMSRLEADRARQDARIEAMSAELADSRTLIAELETRHADLKAGYDRAESQLWIHHATIQRLTEAEIEAKAASEAAQRDIARLVAEKADLLNSTSWRATAPLRRLFRRHPREMRAALEAARIGWWAARFRFGAIRERLRVQARLAREEALLTGDVMFDADYYRRVAPDIDETGWSPARHYLAWGRFRKLSPHPLFDTAWYAEEYGDIGDAAPLVHYIRRGRAEGRKPNALFEPDWYRRRYPEVATAGCDPLIHFMREGAAKGFDPSPHFKTTFYLAQSPDVVQAGINPLVHYLHHGRHEGRQCRGYDVDPVNAPPVTDTPIECRKQPSLHGEVALFVTHSANGRLKPHLRHYLEALHREGVAITLIVAADRGFAGDEPWLDAILDGLYVRGNAGWDFAAWAHVLRLNRHLYRADILYWLNDSLIGPVNERDFHALMARVRQSQAGLVGLTANHERGRHLQSYFLAFKPPALESAAFQQFVQAVRCFPDKDDAINAYEIRLSPILAAAGVPVATIFEPPGEHNPTIYNWKALLDQGFAFLKVMAITNSIRHVDKRDWRETLRAHGYDVILADQLLTELAKPPPRAGLVDWRPAPYPPSDPPKAAFIGPFNYANGLGVASRGYLSALMHTGWALNAQPIARPFHIHRRVAPSLGSSEFAGPADVAIVHLNPDSWDPLLDPPRRDLIARARWRIGAFVWEAHDLPPGFVDRFRELDVVWAPSQYCAAGFAPVSQIPVHVVHYPVQVRPAITDFAGVGRTKAGLGLAPEHRILLYSFDASSYLARKNPLGLLRAFDRSGLAGQGWRLVLKTKHLAAAAQDGVVLAEAAERTAGTLLLDSALGADAARALMDAADIYVSPHAAEGFGLTIAEAMARGKPVIATDYSGSTDFLDASCGFPVRCDPWRLDRDMGPYRRGTLWGRIDEDALARTLMAVAALDPAARAAIGEQARRRIETLLSPAAVAMQMRASIDRLLDASAFRRTGR